MCNCHFTDVEIEPELFSFYNNTELLMEPRIVKLPCGISISIGSLILFLKNIDN